MSVEMLYVIVLSPAVRGMCCKPEVLSGCTAVADPLLTDVQTQTSVLDGLHRYVNLMHDMLENNYTGYITGGGVLNGVLPGLTI